MASIRHGDIRLLRRRNNALFFKQSFRPRHHFFKMQH
ncbi:hypothetical protein LTSEURB_5601, partial [Salmonella enterica subsp. enterica serovar Urbana str. R8-2977]